MFYRSFIQSLPVLMGYLPLGIAFGILFSKELSLDWYYGVLIAILVFTGAGQFLLVSLIVSYAGFLEIAIASFLLNIRHLFYSLAITNEIKNFGITKYYILFGLTDETFAVLKANKAAFNHSLKELERSYFYITFFDHCYWVLGCGIGIFLGNTLGFKPDGVEFALTALFSVLTLSLLQNSPNKKPFYIGLSLGIIGLIIFPSQYFLLLSIFCGIFILLFGRKWIENAR
ncbi:AzlC family ABC transporter permease [Helicobacter sp.]|uniref:AzlC family ABC transporter permease n=1 Tax=Helicobacter sp. TaxID=218 RepID=UPI002583099B|nr:AzlC family ABC transporter permease [Helicobacter sp.]MCI7765852.1 AzlC family ABC transporter permease [Helicobacter sp.]